MLPLMRLAGDKAEHSLRETIETLANEFKLTEQERRELLPSGKQEVFVNRVGWARTYLKRAGLVASAWIFSNHGARAGCLETETSKN